MKKATVQQWDSFTTAIETDIHGGFSFRAESAIVPGKCQERASGVMESQERAELAVDVLGRIMNDEPLVEPVVRVGVAVWIYNNDQHVLLGLRKGSHGAGTWSIPGGHIDFGENPEHTVRREVMEETNMRVGRVIPCLPFAYGHCIFPEDNKQYITLFFNAQWSGDEPELSEPDKCEKWGWFPIDALPKPLFGALDDEDMINMMIMSRNKQND